jgi:hypothetical protein
MQTTSNTPGLHEANKIMAKLHRLGIHDVELMFDLRISMWAVFQVFKPSGKLLLVNSNDYYRTQPTLMWWIKDPLTHKYRVPSEQDLSDIIVTLNRARIVFDKGSDWLVDKAEEQERKDYEERKRKQSERIRSYAKPLKKYIRKELL